MTSKTFFVTPKCLVSYSHINTITATVTTATATPSTTINIPNRTVAKKAIVSSFLTASKGSPPETVLQRISAARAVRQTCPSQNAEVSGPERTSLLTGLN